jgi:SNF2 family DNA or RNA helicase
LVYKKEKVEEKTMNEGIFSKGELLHFNNVLLQRGAPNEKDDFGYNKPDFGVCITYYNGLSEGQYKDLTNRLIKYCNTQLDIDVEKMKNTNSYYTNIVKGETDLINHVSVSVAENNNVRISFRYNPTFISVIHTESKTAKYDKLSHAYLVDKRESLHLLEKLKEKGAICENAIQYLVEKGIIDEYTNLLKETVATDDKYKIKLTELQNGTIDIAFKFDYTLLNCIKALNYRKYNGDTKSWSVNKADLRALKQAIIDAYKEKLHYDLSDFDKFTENIIPKKAVPLKTPKFIINCIQNSIKLLISFTYNKKIVALIKSLKSTSWDGELKGYKINPLELPLLINMLETMDTNLNLDYSQLTTINNLLTRPEKTYKLMDYKQLERIPFKHQLSAAETLLTWKQGILADEQGLGKTTSFNLIAESIQGKKLIVCPDSLKLNWAKEIKMISEKPIFVAKNTKIWRSCEGWTIVNYDIIKKFKENIIAEKFKVVGFDEAHYIKSIDNYGEPDSSRSKIALEIADTIPYVFPLTGTPIPNHIKDIFNLFRLIRHPISIDFFSFAQRYCDPKNYGFGWDYNGCSNKEELNEILNSCMIRRLKKDAIDLPEKFRQFIPLEIDLVEYNKKLKDYFAKRKNYTSKGQHLVELNALKHILAKEKVKYTIDIADNIILQDKPVVIFTAYSYVVDALRDHYKENCVVIDGKTPSNKKQDAVDRFQNGEVKVFIGNIIAAGVGLTLTKACNLIFNDLTFVPSLHQQAEDRIHRISQDELCNIYFMYAGNVEIEVRLANMLDNKLRNISKVVDGEELDFTDDIVKALQNQQIKIKV